MVLAFSVCVGTARAEEAEQAELDQAAEEYNEQVENERDEVVCELVAQTGSRIKEKRCRTRARIEQDAEQAKRYIRKQRPVPTSGS
jgi:hypothetical protein